MSHFTKITLGASTLLALATGFNVISANRASDKAESLKSEIVTVQKEAEGLKAELEELQQDLSESQKVVFHQLNGFNPDLITNDENLVTAYLNLIFEWKDGASYDKQRNELLGMSVTGGDVITRELMPENLRSAQVSEETLDAAIAAEEAAGAFKKAKDVEEAKAKAKEQLRKDLAAVNDVDLNQLKSRISSADLIRLSWNAEGDAVYVADVTHQLYRRDRDTRGDHQATGRYLLTFIVSGTGSERAVTSVRVGHPV